MPQLIALGLLGAGLYAGYRWIARQGEQVAAQLREAEEALRRREAARVSPANAPRLEADPETGIYRPAGKS